MASAGRGSRGRRAGPGALRPEWELNLRESVSKPNVRSYATKVSLQRKRLRPSLPGEDAVLLLLYGLLRSGQIVLRRIDGRHDMAKLNPQVKAA